MIQDPFVVGGAGGFLPNGPSPPPTPMPGLPPVPEPGPVVPPSNIPPSNPVPPPSSLSRPNVGSSDLNVDLTPPGGCAGTEYGCCPDGIRAQVDEFGSNCPRSRPRTSGGLSSLLVFRVINQLFPPRDPRPRVGEIQLREEELPRERPDLPRERPYPVQC